MSKNHTPSTIRYQPVIGLEVHIELKTKSKMFCGCSADYFGKTPNTRTCPVCLGLPGALPVPNKKAIEWCVKIGMALNCRIPLFAKFDRKNYFYPDLPKGYQISQYDQPFCSTGSITLNSGKKIGITRVHMEEDTGKLIHEKNGEETSLIDFNRSGVPLVEIVTEPDFSSASEVVEYLKKLRQIVRFLGVSNADMEKGDMRLEPNISLAPGELRVGDSKNNALSAINHLPPYKVEVKNINSFKFVEKAINFEIERQSNLLSRNITPRQETRSWNEEKNETVSQRVKEEANDYRYFPEPDIPPVRWTEEQLEAIKTSLPELPDKLFKRFQEEYTLSPYDAEILTRDLETVRFFEHFVKMAAKKNISPKQTANYIINKKINVNSVTAQELLRQISSSNQTVAVDENDLNGIISEVLSENQKAAADYKSGKETAIMFLVGNVMKKLGKKADAQMIKGKLELTLKQYQRAADTRLYAAKKESKKTGKNTLITSDESQD